MSRNLSSRLNSIDNNGVLEGNWSGDYTGGRSPTSWIASEQIFSEYMKTKEPVKYGQCFIYSAIFTTGKEKKETLCSLLMSRHDNELHRTLEGVVVAFGGWGGRCCVVFFSVSGASKQLKKSTFIEL